MQTHAEHLHQRWMEQAQAEEACLVQLVEAVVALRRALAAADMTALPELLRGLEPALNEQAELRRSRQSLTQELASLPGSGPGLDRLAAALPAAVADILGRRRHRLRELAVGLERSTRAAAMVAEHQLDFLGGFFQALTQAPASGNRYGPAGQLQAPAAQPLLQLNG